MDKPQKPTNLLPRSFGGQKEAFDADKIANGYQSDVPDILGGANLNDLLDKLGKELDYTETIADFVNGLPIDNIITTDENNKLVYKDIKEVGCGGLELFDTVLKDHILTFEETEGLALQGTYVYKTAVAGSRYGYPDFIQKCIGEKNAGTATQVTLGDNTITMYINANGHQFYDIADKSAVDAFYDTWGIAWFYGIDTENERVFLPRKKLYYGANSTAPVAVYGNGKSIGFYDGRGNYAGISHGGSAHFDADWSYYNVNLPKASGSKDGFVTNYVMGLTNHPDASGIVGTADTSSILKEDDINYLYICVGNTEQQSAITDVIDITTSENDTLPLFTAMYFNFKPNHPSWLKAGQQQNKAGIYESTYNTLVNCLTAANNIYDLKVIETSDMVTGTDYSEYWQVNQDSMWFKTPTRTSKRILVDKKEPTADDLSWYNLYSDGWCEQGGQLSLGTANAYVPITLLKSYKDTSYSVTATNAGATATSTTYNVKVGNNNTNTTDKVYLLCTNANTGVIWRTAGYTEPQTVAQLYFKVANAVENLELLNAGEVLEALTDKADKTAVDGQWVFFNAPVRLYDTSSTAAETLLSLSLSEYLPTDGYNYEIMVTGYTFTPNQTYVETRVTAYTDLMFANNFVEFLGVRSASGQNGGYSNTTLILPVGTGRQINFKFYSGSAVTSRFTLVGYRRLGTNV